jgi:cyanophycinase-like exopeptidase
MNLIKHFFFFFIINSVCAQDYTSYFTGNTVNVSTNPEFGICMMGGAGENDNAMQWFLNLADGGDVLVLRTSGSDGYNDYMFNQLGVNLNSVETIRIDQASGATSTYVLQKISDAEAIWFAGGDQADYVNFFKDNSVESLINDHINVKQYPIGGISAGMAILGEYYFDALNGTITSNEALSDPFDPGISLGFSDFINNPSLKQTITDTHYDNPEREGRHLAFLARIQQITGDRVFGIGIDEFTSVCIDKHGIAQIFGEFPAFNDYAYFLQVNCLDNTIPENLASNQSLDWNLNQQAVKVYKVPGNQNGSNQFDLNTWDIGTGGEWQNWWVDQGSFQSQSSAPIDCEVLTVKDLSDIKIELYPNPTNNFLNLRSVIPISKIEISDLSGKKINTYETKQREIQVDLTALSKGIYFLKIIMEDDIKTIRKIVKE